MAIAARLCIATLRCSHLLFIHVIALHTITDTISHHQASSHKYITQVSHRLYLVLGGHMHVNVSILSKPVPFYYLKGEVRADMSVVHIPPCCYSVHASTHSIS